MKTRGSLPLQLKFLFEGEEEVGSEALYRFIESEPDRLACDVAVISDCSQFGPGQPAITYGLKGIAYFELRLTGPKQDLHSGTFGGAVTNPANALNRIMSQLIDEHGRIQIPGFYDDVIELTEREREQFAGLAFDEESFKQRLGVNGLTGEEGYTTLERRWARPTLDINGMWSGYQGEGAKTVLPARAGVKFSCRLVPNQDPAKIQAALRKKIESLCPPGITAELIDMHSATGVLVPLDSPFIESAAKAVEAGFGKPPVFIREGGSIPVVTEFHQKLGIDTLLLGWGQDDDNTHSPNEKFSLEDFHRGIKASAHLWEELSQVKV
jgi:succinyl-diaminopimelate desuccinylase